MKVRFKKTKEEAHASRFNIHAMAEVFVVHDSVPVHDLDVWVNGRWKDMRKAFEDRDIIPNNLNTWFAEPVSEIDRRLGYFL